MSEIKPKMNGYQNEKEFKIRFLSIQIFFLFLTIVASFTGTLFIKVTVGHIHLFPYRFLLFFMWFLFLINIIFQNWRLTLSNIRVRIYLQFLGLWLCYAFLSLTWAISKYDGVRNIIFLFSGISIIFFLILYFRDLNQLKRLYFLWLLIYALLLLVGIWEVTTGNHLETSALYKEERPWVLFAPTAVFHNQNDFAGYIALTLPMVLAWIRYCQKLIGRAIGVFIIIVGLWLLILTTSRSCYIAVLTGMVFWFLFLLRWNEKIKALALAVFLCIFFVVAFPSKTQNILKIMEIQADSLVPIILQSKDIGSLYVRLNLIKNALYFNVKSAGFGVGAGNVEYYMEYFKIYPVNDITNVHNWWVEILANYGLFILAGYLIFYFSLFCRLWGVYKEVDIRTEKMLCEALLVGLVSFIMASISSSSIIAFRPQWLFIGFALAFLNYFRVKKTAPGLKCIS